LKFDIEEVPLPFLFAHICLISVQGSSCWAETEFQNPKTKNTPDFSTGPWVGLGVLNKPIFNFFPLATC